MAHPSLPAPTWVLDDVQSMPNTDIKGCQVSQLQFQTYTKPLSSTCHPDKKWLCCLAHHYALVLELDTLFKDVP